MKAMILSAGFGSRLKPLTLDQPKPLLKIGNETLLSNTLKFLDNYGIDHVVINVHYLSEKIINYINGIKLNFNFNITVVEEKAGILDTGGGVLNAIQHFSNEKFLVINPDTIWNANYLYELKSLEKLFTSILDSKCLMLVVDKDKSFDKSFKGDFNLKKNLITRSEASKSKYIFTGLQLVKPEIFYGVNSKVFSINKIWDQLISNKQLYGMESKINFLHVSTLRIYKDLIKQYFKH